MRLLLAAWLGTTAAWTAAPRLGSSRAADASYTTRPSTSASMLLEDAQGPEALLRLCAAAWSQWPLQCRAPLLCLLGVPSRLGARRSPARLGAARRSQEEAGPLGAHLEPAAPIPPPLTIQVPPPTVASDARAPSARSSPRSCATWRATRRPPTRPCSTVTGGSCMRRRRLSTAPRPSSGHSSRQPQH